jgi:hypothetical protein
MTTDPQQERERLSKFYAGISDAELDKVVSDADSLTDLARETLEEERLRRGLPPISKDEPEGITEVEERDLVMVGQFRDLPEALLAKGSLDSAGIESFITDDNMVRLDWLISNLLGGIKLSVNSVDAAAAREILSQPIPEVLDVEGVGPYQQPACPKCQSLDVNFEELDKAVSYTSLLVVPLPVQTKGWHCHSCGYRWPGDDATAVEL